MLASDSATNLLEQGISAVKQRRRTEAYQLLSSAVQADPSNERAWLWLSGAVESDAERRYCLERALAINPASVAAQRGLAQLPPGDAIAPGLGAAHSVAESADPRAPDATQASVATLPEPVAMEAVAPPQQWAELPSPDRIFLTHPKNASFIYGSSSRPAVLSGVTATLLLILATVIVSALALGSFALRDLAREIIFNQGNAPATGTVVDRDVSRGRRSTSYYVIYTYYDGRSMREQVDRSTYERLQPGATIPVRYATSNPSIAHIEGNNSVTWPVIGVLVSMLFVGGAIFGLVRAIGSLGDDRRLQQSGRLLPGALLDAKIRKGSKGNASLEVRYSFRSPTSGKQIEAKIQRPRKDLRNELPPAIGTPVAVLHADDECYVVL
jgi:hypothetical protein